MARKAPKLDTDDDDELSRIRRRAEIMPSDEDDDDFDEESEEEEQEDEQLSRMRRRAEIAPSDDDDDDDSDDFDDEDSEGGDKDKSREVDDDDSGEDVNDPNDEASASSEEEVQYDGISSDEDEDDEDERGDEDEAVELRRARKKPLREVSLADRLAMKMDGGDGAVSTQRHRKFAVSAWGGKDGSGDQEWGGWNSGGSGGGNSKKQAQEEAKQQRKSKHAPMEMSTKHAVSRHRDVVEVKKAKAVDPRFIEALTGGSSSGGGSKKAQAEMAEFLEQKRSTELKALEHAIKKEKRRRGGRAAASEEAKVEVLKQAAARLKQGQGERKRAAVAEGALADWRKEERAKVAAGKQPFFLKRKAAKELVVSKQYEELSKGKGGKRRAEKHDEKKRKKSTAKERKWVPEERGAERASKF
jgi:ribosomal RNA-processing protein 36